MSYSEEQLKSLGRYSRWQITIYCLLALSMYTASTWQSLNIVFIGGLPSFECHSDDNTTFKGQCTTNGSRKCDAIAYDPEFGSSIVTEWSLYCKMEAVALSQSFFATAMIIGGMASSYLADKHGRKPVHFFSTIGLAVCGGCLAGAPSIVWFCILRAASGLFVPGANYTPRAMCSELFSTEQRTFAGVMHQILWPIMVVLMALIHYFMRDWRYFQLIISCAPLIYLSFYFVIPESIVWLYSKGRTGEADEIIEKARKFNNVYTISNESICKDNNPESSDEALAEENAEPENQNISSVLKSRHLTIYSIILVYGHFVVSIVYDGLALSVASVVGDIYVNIIFGSVVEIVANVICMPILTSYGRVRPMIASFLVAGVSLGATAFLPIESFATLSRIAVFTGRLATSAAFIIIVAYCPEVFPTPIRSSGIALASYGSNLGSIIAPFYYLLALQVYWLPLVISAGLSAVAGLASIYLPETFRHVLPDSIADVERWNQRNKVDDKVLPTEEAI